MAVAPIFVWHDWRTFYWSLANTWDINGCIAFLAMLPAAQSLPNGGVVYWAQCTAADLPGRRTAYSLHCWLLLCCLPIRFTPADPWCAVCYTRLELKGRYTVLRSVLDGSSFSVLAQEGPLVGAVIAANASN